MLFNQNSSSVSPPRRTSTISSKGGLTTYQRKSMRGRGQTEKKVIPAPDDLANLTPEKLNTRYAPEEHIDEVKEVDEVEDSILDESYPKSTSNSNKALKVKPVE